MGDELEFESGGAGAGTATIETAEMARDAAALGVLAELARGWQRHLGEVLRFDVDLAPQWTGGSVGASTFTARAGALSVASGAEFSGAALLEAAKSYGVMEAQLTLLLQGGGTLLGWAAGALANPISAAVLLGGVAALGGGVVVANALGLIDIDAMVEALRQHPELIVNPAFVDLIATVVASVDDGVMAALDVPLPLALALGDQGAGIIGTDTAAAGIITLGTLLTALGLPLFQRSGFALRPPVNSQAGPPTSLKEAAARIPPSLDGAPQVRIERYVHPDGTTGWIVYATGTVEWSPMPGTEPSDLSSNLSEVAGQGSEMRSAILEAMREAGMQPGDEVITVGHSQAGMVLARIAVESDFNVVAELSFGSPTRQISVPDGTVALAFEHNDDLVPVLGGVAVDPSESVGRIVVSRTAFDALEVPDGEFFAAHQMEQYRDTAGLADDSDHPAVEKFREILAAVTGDQDADVTERRADRVWPAEGVNGGV